MPDPRRRIKRCFRYKTSHANTMANKSDPLTRCLEVMINFKFSHVIFRYLDSLTGYTLVYQSE